jgi:glycerol-3-phosphate dehydrogenase (NAD(P)+)
VTRIAVVGAGSWGTALADMLARHGARVVVWAHEPEVAAEINSRHRNDLFLPEAPLHESLAATNDLAEAVGSAEVIVAAPPSHVMRAVMTRAAGAMAPGTLVISASKGLEPGSLKRMTQVLGDVLPAGSGIVALSGPTFAREVYERQPTAATVAGPAEAARRAQQVLAVPYFRTYTNDDTIGVELGGALKNVVAIAAGILEGLGMGSNPRAALITRGLAEIARLGIAMGASPLTFAGLAGMGDLVLTATGPLSRNRSLGAELGKGRTLEQIQARRLSVAEGVGTARTAVALGERVGVELPIAREVSRVLFEGKAPRQAVADLMERALRTESLK